MYNIAKVASDKGQYEKGMSFHILVLMHECMHGIFTYAQYFNRPSDPLLTPPQVAPLNFPTTFFNFAPYGVGESGRYLETALFLGGVQGVIVMEQAAKWQIDYVSIPPL